MRKSILNKRNVLHEKINGENASCKDTMPTSCLSNVILPILFQFRYHGCFNIVEIDQY